MKRTVIMGGAFHAPYASTARFMSDPSSSGLASACPTTPDRASDMPQRILPDDQQVVQHELGIRERDDSSHGRCPKSRR